MVSKLLRSRDGERGEEVGVSQRMVQYMQTPIAITYCNVLAALTVRYTADTSLGVRERTNYSNVQLGIGKIEMVGLIVACMHVRLSMCMMKYMHVCKHGWTGVHVCTHLKSVDLLE